MGTNLENIDASGLPISFLTHVFLIYRRWKNQNYSCQTSLPILYGIETLKNIPIKSTF